VPRKIEVPGFVGKYVKARHMPPETTKPEKPIPFDEALKRLVNAPQPLKPRKGRERAATNKKPRRKTGSRGGQK
jgi:hypothetical protein